MIFFGETLYTYRPDKMNSLLENAINVLIRNSLVISVGLVISSGTYAAYPAYTYLFLDERPFIIPMYLPFVDADTWIGYHIHVSVQFIISATGIYGAIGMETLLTMIVNNIFTGVSIIEYELKELSDLLEKKKIGSLERKRSVRSILMKVRDMDE